MSYLSGLVSMWLGFSFLGFAYVIEAAIEKFWRMWHPLPEEEPNYERKWRSTRDVISVVNDFEEMRAATALARKAAFEGSLPPPAYLPERSSRIPTVINYIPEVKYIRPVRRPAAQLPLPGGAAGAPDDAIKADTPNPYLSRAPAMRRY